MNTISGLSGLTGGKPCPGLPKKPFTWVCENFSIGRSEWTDCRECPAVRINTIDEALKHYDIWILETANGISYIKDCHKNHQRLMSVCTSRIGIDGRPLPSDLHLWLARAAGQTGITSAWAPPPPRTVPDWPKICGGCGGPGVTTFQWFECKNKCKKPFDMDRR